MKKKILGMLGLSLLIMSMFAIFNVMATPHAEIGIGDDSELAFFAVSGDGSEETPYIISGYEITGTDACISVTGTTKHFIIEDCTLYDATYGVRLTNLPNGTVRDCEIYGHGQNGIFVNNCTDIMLSGNTIYDCDEAIINVWHSEYVTVDDNDVRSGVMAGINMIANHSVITNNFVFNMSIGHLTGNPGIWVGEPSHNITITHNIGIGNVFGILIWGCTDPYIFNNTFYLNGCFVRQQGSNYLVEWKDGSGAGLYADDVHYGIVLNNTFRGNALSGATFGQMTSNNEIRYNIFDQNPVAMYDNGTANVIDSNYYSDYEGGGSYLILGTAENIDLNPYGPPIIIEPPPLPPVDIFLPLFAVLVVGFFVFLGVVTWNKRSDKVESGRKRKGDDDK